MTTPEPSAPCFSRGIRRGSTPKNSRNGTGMSVGCASARRSTRIVTTAGATLSTIGLYDVTGVAAAPGTATGVGAGEACSDVVADSVATTPDTPAPTSAAASAIAAVRATGRAVRVECVGLMSLTFLGRAIVRAVDR